MAIAESEVDERSTVLDGVSEFWLLRSDSSATQARARLLGLLRRTESGERFVEAGTLIVTELVSNAVKHGSRRGERVFVRLDVSPARLRIDVHDASRVRPVVRDVDALEEHGRGLRVVVALADEWGFGSRPYGFGKIVWAVVIPERGGC
ncbi:ATP-binding protein [Kitasatospora sp. GAS204B]|uniref:ATP-binding protein n=1 Tax=unclassified Kitasatospora TaxID=2633591 RepID=UPI0024768343|nr:ATP-binding protein [Kitasatospora sp. GAS204B]MDH6122728.1 anti-sigma regulatory factor (Ser/Thr protein kinase) [Kitasatospora sp. GAS204B]